MTTAHNKILMKTENIKQNLIQDVNFNALLLILK